MFKEISGLLVNLALILLMVSCSEVATDNVQITNTASIVSNVSESNNQTIAGNFEVDSEKLCIRLSEIKKIPYDPLSETGDPIYNGLIKNGIKSIPCLIEKITDTTEIKDPREAPIVRNFKVGDAAVFMLLYISNESWQPETMLSPEIAKRWKSEGVYAYFDFVRNNKNREKVKTWWKVRYPKR